jgi:hypothetical protein
MTDKTMIRAAMNERMTVRVTYLRSLDQHAVTVNRGDEILDCYPAYATADEAEAERVAVLFAGTFDLDISRLDV